LREGVLGGEKKGGRKKILKERDCFLEEDVCEEAWINSTKKERNPSTR